MGTHNDFGKLGEELAAKFLSKNGYVILHRNFRYLKAEIDIIARKDDVLAIVEVKSRSSEFIQEIASTVNQKKIGLLALAADHYVNEHHLDIEVRFDVITIVKNNSSYQVNHLEDAFFHF